MVIITILISAALAISAWGESKQDILRNLRKNAASPSALAKYASSLKQSSQQEAVKLTYDLIIYRWMWPQSSLPSRITAKTSTDIENVDAIIKALITALRDDSLKWADAYFALNPGNVPLAPRGDKRPEALANLRKYVEAARDARESSPVNAVRALFDACAVCNDSRFYLDMTKGLLLKEIADHYQNTMSNYLQADTRYGEASLMFSNHNCLIAYAVTYEDWAELNIKRSQFSNTAKYFELAARSWVDLSKAHPNKYEYLDLAGGDYIRAGYALNATMQKSDAPLNMIQSGLDRLKEWTYANNKTDKSYDLLINSLIEVSEFLRERSETSRAKGYLEEALALSEKQNDLLVQAKLYGGFEKLYRAVKQNENADGWKQKRSDALQAAVSAADAALKSLTAADFSSASSQIALCGTVERGALAHRELLNYASAADMWRQVAERYKALGLVDDQIRALKSYAESLDSQQKLGEPLNVQKANESLNARLEAVLTARRAGKNAEAAGIIPDMINTYTALGDLNNALEAFKDLAPINEAAGNIRGVAQVLEARGFLLAKNEQYEEAAKDYAEARRNYKDNVGDPWAAGKVSVQLAEAYVRMGKLDSACDILDSSLNDIEGQYRTENMNSGANAERNKQVMNLYSALAAVYVHTGQTDKASSLLGKKARLYSWCPALISTMTVSNDPAIAAFAKALPLTNPDGLGIDPTGDGDSVQWAKDWKEFFQACLRLQQNYRASYDAIPVDPLDVYQYRSRLPKDTELVMYMITDSSLYVFLCDPDKAAITELRLQRSDLLATLQQLRKSMKTYEGNVSQGIPVQEIVTWQEPAFQDVKGPLQKLYTQLLKPLESSLSGKTRLVFVLPDELNGLPMHALITSDQETVPKFLIESYEIGYLGSGMLGYLVSKNDILDSGTSKLVIFSDPDSNLPGAQSEVKNILRNYPNNSKAYQKNNATETSFLRECQTAGIIHIAAHHRIDADPSQFQMLLAPDENADGIVGIEELSAIQAPQLGLVVLSACDSISSSDPVSTGPSRAAEVFSRIGAKSVMGGLWKVSDESAAELMNSFYSNIAKGHMSRAESLRRAQLDMIRNKRFAHPFYWACFALYGNPR